MTGFILFLSLVLTAHVSIGDDTCFDVDSAACVSMERSNPGLCSSDLGQTACPRYCGKCPLLCYTCSELVQDISQCNITTCHMNQTCYSVEVFDFDQSHGFQAGCVAKELCVPHGGGFNLIGRSSSRVQTECCDTDKCNKKDSGPVATTSAWAFTISTSDNGWCFDNTPNVCTRLLACIYHRRDCRKTCGVCLSEHRPCCGNLW